MISVIVRAKDEEAWIRRCLAGVKAQRVDHEVEVVLVDNMSTDLTVVKAKTVWPDLTLVTIEEFLPGRALNLGTEAAQGDLIVCLSAHCIPVDDQWLSALARNLEDGVAGVYGRQLPTASTSPSDRRDLTIVFGLDRKVQQKDPFFHNANSMIPRAVLDEFPFRDDVTNIEDRLWAEQVLAAGLTVVYEPDAQVFHHHGIHHGNDADRARSTARVLSEPEQLSDDLVELSQPTLVGILPLGEHLGRRRIEDCRELIESTAAVLHELSESVDVHVSAATERTAEIAVSMGLDILSFTKDRPSENDARVDDVLRFELARLEASGIFPDGILSLEISYPNRPLGLIRELIAAFAESPNLTACAGFSEYRQGYIRDEGTLRALPIMRGRREERSPIWFAVPGLGCISTPWDVRSGVRLGREVALVEVTDPNHRLEVRD